MRGISTSVEINRPAAEIFSFLVAIENNPKWMTMMKTVTLVSGEPGQAGASYRQLGSAMGQEIEGTLDVLEIDPNMRLLTQTTAGPMKVKTEMLLTEKPRTTTVSMTVDPGMMGAIMGPLVRKDGLESLNRLKALLES